MSIQATEHGHGEQPQTGANVSIRVDNVEKQVHRGSYLVSELKQLVGVDPALELAEAITGQLTPLGDSDRITIKGGEVLFSRVRQGGSS
jgi:hypothetical protein